MTPPPATRKPTVRRTYRYRLYPTRTQIAALELQLSWNCDLYNAALEQRRDAWRRGRKRVGLYDQMRDLTELRQDLPGDQMACHLQRDPLRRLDRAFQAFYRRCQTGEAPGYPRFRSKARYDSLIWPIGKGAVVHTGRLRIMGAGAIRVRWHREIPVDAKIKTITVKRNAGRWYAYFSIEIPLPEPLPATGEVIGVDLGISTFAALSTGELVEGPRAYRKAQRELRVAQRRVDRRKRGSLRRRKAVAILARKHERVRNSRRDHAHKTALDLTQRFDLIAVENLNTRGLARSRLAKDVNDQGWATFLTLLRDKAEWAGREVVEVDPRYTSQTCAECEVVDAASRSGQRFCCASCGHRDNADVNAARNILNRAVGTRPSGANGGAKWPEPWPEKPREGAVTPINSNR